MLLLGQVQVHVRCNLFKYIAAPRSCRENIHGEGVVVEWYDLSHTGLSLG